jgi:hypothetical protein
MSGGTYLWNERSEQHWVLHSEHDRGTLSTTDNGNNPKDEAVAHNETPEPAGPMTDAERNLLRQYLGGHQMYAEVNGRRFTVLYSSRHNGDPMPWIYAVDPALRFVNEVVTADVTKCKVCGDNVGTGYAYRADFPAMDLCERHAVAELAGDLVQIEKGNLK